MIELDTQKENTTTFDQALQKLAELFPEKFFYVSTVSDTLTISDGFSKAMILTPRLSATQDSIDEILAEVGWRFLIRLVQNKRMREYKRRLVIDFYDLDWNFQFTRETFTKEKPEASKAALEAVVEKLAEGK